MKKTFVSIFQESLPRIAIRFMLYFVMIFSLTLSLPNLFKEYGILIFLENQTVEWLQFSILMMTGVMFLISTRWLSRFKELFLLLASIIAFAMVRELDVVLDHLIPLIGWKIGFIFIFYFFWVAFKGRAVLSSQLMFFFGTRSFAILFCGFLVASSFSQLVGNGDFLKTLMGGYYTSDYKRVIEELGELFGYLLLFIGALEAVSQMEHVLENRE